MEDHGTNSTDRELHEVLWQMRRELPALCQTLVCVIHVHVHVHVGEGQWGSEFLKKGYVI